MVPCFLISESEPVKAIKWLEGNFASCDVILLLVMALFRAIV